MANVYTYNGIIDIFKDISERHPLINGLFVGEDFEKNAVMDEDYPLLQVYFQNSKLPVSQDGGYPVLQTTMICKILDRTLQNQINEIDGHSDCQQVALDVINELNQHPFYQNSTVQITNDIEINKIQESFDDYLHGVEFNLDFRIINNNNWCGLPFEPIPTYSMSGPVSSGYSYSTQFLTCDTVTGCTTLRVYIQQQIDLIPTGSTGVAFVNNGINTFTGGTPLFQSVNITGGTFNNLNITGGTLSSGGTDLYSIFLTTADGNDITRVQPGSNITTGGTPNLPIVSVVLNPVFTSLSATSLSAGTFYSGSTPLETIIINIASGSTPAPTAQVWTASTGVNSGVLIGGNSIVAGFLSIAAGSYNTIDNNSYSSILGGYNNQVKGNSSIIGGGNNNIILPYSSANFIGAGNSNSTQYNYSSVVGGLGNRATQSYSSVLGGQSNTADGQHSSVVGGYNNRASGQFSSILNGVGNATAAHRTAVIGGFGITGTTDDSVYTPAHKIISVADEVALEIKAFSARTQPLIYVTDFSLAELFRVNTDSQFNLFVGNNSGLQTSSAGGGIHNYGFGFHTLKDNITGFRNVAIGSYAQELNLNGTKNTSLGYAALYQNQGDNNSGFGDQALFNNISGFANMAFGTNSLYNNTFGNFNVGIGVNALFANLIGSSNVGIGNSAAQQLLGSENVAIGNQALINAMNVDGNVAIGNGAAGNEMGSNNLYIANTNTSFPLIYGYFPNNLLVLNGLNHSGRTANTTYVDKLNITTVTGTPNVALFLDANNFVVTGTSSSVSLTARNGVTATGTTIELGGNLIRTTDINLSGFNFTFSNGGRVGINTVSPQTALHVEGDLFIPSVYGGRIANVGIGGYAAWAAASNEITTYSSATGNNLIIQNLGGGLTGFGLLSPSAKVHLRGINTSSNSSVFKTEDSSSATTFDIRNNGTIISLPTYNDLVDTGVTSTVGIDSTGRFFRLTATTPSTFVQPGRNILTGGTSSAPTINLVNSPNVNNFTASGTTGLKVTSATTLTSTFVATDILTATTRASIGTNSLNLVNPETLLVQDNVNTGSSYSNVFVGKANTNNYSQLNIINLNSGNMASSDIVATSANGDENVNFIDMGINSSAFTGTVGYANDAYVYSTGNDLLIGNASSNKAIKFFTDGTTSAQTRMTITSAQTFVNGLFTATTVSAVTLNGSVLRTDADVRIHSNYTDSTFVSGVTNTLSKSYLVPANTFRTGDMVEVDAQLTKIGVSGTCTMRLYVAPTNSLTAATVLATFATLATNLTAKLYRRFTIKSATQTEAINTTNPLNSDFASSTAARTLVNIDWTQPQYIIAAVQNAAAGTDSSQISSFSIRRL